LGEFLPLARQEVKARGIVVPLRWAELSFPTSGQLAEFTVTPSETVSTGQVLAQLETQDLKLQVQLAQSELALREADADQVQEGASESEIAAAQTGYEAAVAAYDEVQAGPGPEEMIIAEADLKRAEVALRRAQAAYDAVSSLPNIGARPESTHLESVTLDYQRAKAAYELAIAEPDEPALKQAEALIKSAKAELEALQKGTPPSKVRAAEASMAKARANLARAQLALKQAALRAPFQGTITSTRAQPAGMIPAGTTVLTLADLSQLQVETTDLDEWGAANVAINQGVDLLIPGLANRSLRGHVIFVSREPTITPSGAVFYKAVVALDEGESDLRWGMTVQLQFGSLGE